MAKKERVVMTKEEKKEARKARKEQAKERREYFFNETIPGKVIKYTAMGVTGALALVGIVALAGLAVKDDDDDSVTCEVAQEEQTDIPDEVIEETETPAEDDGGF